ncbi:MAG: hypothetical protein U0836_16310 [Pirellulales bacterium]
MVSAWPQNKPGRPFFVRGGMNGVNQPLWTVIEEPHRSEAEFWAFFEAVWAEFKRKTGLRAVVYGVDPARGPSQSTVTVLMLPAPAHDDLQGARSA